MSKKERIWVVSGGLAVLLFAVAPYILPRGLGHTVRGPFAVWTVGCALVIAAGALYTRFWNGSGRDRDVR